MNLNLSGLTTYTTPRDITAALPLYRVDERGDVQEIARLDLTCPDGCAAEFLAGFQWPLDGNMQAGWFDGLPYPLNDMRPQGFLGRNFARHHADHADNAKVLLAMMSR